MSAWNWKAALFSSTCRALLFFGSNLSEGLDAAIAAGQVEFVYRAIASGFYGGLTERFSKIEPAARSTAAALILIPALAHTVEYLIHTAAGTPRLGSSIAASVLFSVAATRFNLFAMRRGLLTVGRGSRSLAYDVVALTRLCIGGTAGFVRECSRQARVFVSR